MIPRKWLELSRGFLYYLLLFLVIVIVQGVRLLASFCFSNFPIGVLEVSKMVFVKNKNLGG
jgi:hypothetical protein